MFKATIEDGQCTVESAGSLINIIFDVARAVGAVYEGLQKANTLDAELFEAGIIRGLSADSPAWSFARNAEGIVIAKPQTEKKWRCPHRSKLGHRAIEHS